MFLQWRMFFYRDVQMYNLGANMHQIPVNCPFMTANYAHQSYDGAMRVDNTNQDRLNYQPNSYDKPTYSERSVEVPFAVADPIYSRQSHYENEGTDVEYVQAGGLYKRVMDKPQRSHLYKNTAVRMNAGVSQTTCTRYLAQV